MKERPPTRRGPGRPREFDEDDALEEAMQTFWVKGFTRTSLDDLLCATGMARQSLYRVFGDKRALFRKVLDRYGAMHRGMLQTLLQDNPSPLAGLDALVDLWESSALEDDFSGCLNLNSLAEFAAVEDDEIQDVLHTNLADAEGAIIDALSRAVALGELELRRTPTEVAHSLLGTAQALSHLGRYRVQPALIHNIAAGARDLLGAPR